MTINSLLLRFVALLALAWACHARHDHHRRRASTLELQFYMHDNTAPPNTTVVQVARPAGASASSTFFGTVAVIDDLITEGPSASSKVVGRGQGTYIFDSINTVSLLLTFTAVFENDYVHKGSLSFQGADRVGQKKREISVVGGTGSLRFARGYAIIETHSLTYSTTVLFFNVSLKW